MQLYREASFAKIHINGEVMHFKPKVMRRAWRKFIHAFAPEGMFRLPEYQEGHDSSVNNRYYR